MPIDPWKRRLDIALTPREVVDAAHEFLAQLTHREIFSLPDGCLPPATLDGEAIGAYAFDLITHECHEGEDTAEVVHRLASFFGMAANRMAQLSARSRSGTNPDSWPATLFNSVRPAPRSVPDSRA